MRKYEKVRHVVNSDSLIFQDQVEKEIRNIQSTGLSLEVQYQIAPMRETLYYIRYSALILGYKEV